MEQKVDVYGEYGQSKNVQSFKEIVEEQLEKMAEMVVKVMKENEALVRSKVDKKKCHCIQCKGENPKQVGEGK